MNVQLNGLEIAIIGLSGQFPGSQTIQAFWENLQAGVESISVFSNAEALSPKAASHESDRCVKAGAVLNDIEYFDASFFGYNPREAETMDPQHRLFLECAWSALEDAGYNTETEVRPIGVYAGVGMGTYLLYNLSPNPDLIESRGFLQTLVGVDKDYLSSRVSYKLNLTGPSVSVGTACSSSLVSVHLACQSLLSGECDMAVAAGVAVKVPQNALTLAPDEIVSSDGHCRAFDAKANGTIGGNGVGAVVLKRLEDAIADRDCIYAVIKGSAINNDGALKVGYTAPSQAGQAKVIRAAQVMADVEPETITYMEAHGTGTSLGDPIEIAAMTQAFRSSTAKKGYCAIGSVKTNVGHLDAAAGMAGLIKTVLALHHKVLPPSLNFETPNPQIDFESSPFYVNTQRTEWITNALPRRAGVSSFGFGGTNAHLILEEAPPRAASSPSRSLQLLVLSAKTRSALETATTHLAQHLTQHSELNLADVAYTLQVGRRGFQHRRILVADTLETASQLLASDDPQRVLTHSQESIDRPVVFMFTGQGAQYVNMARELYDGEPTFRQICDRCFALIKPQLGFDLRQVLYPDSAAVEQATQQLQQTAVTQPALFIIEYALAQLWMSWGIRPAAMIGHSLGEYVAACLSGVFSLEDALSLVCTRGQLMQQLPGGAMLSIGLPAEAVQPLLNDNLSLAASNSAALSVVSGSVEAVEALEHQLTQAGINIRRLQTSHAFHSNRMDAIIEPFKLAVRQVSLHAPQIPWVANVTGTWITPSEATDPDYWARHLRQTVQFAPGITELLHDAESLFLEVGPGQTLSTFTQQQSPERLVFSSLRHPKTQQSDVAFLLNTLGRLWLSGVKVDWTGFYAHESRDRLPLPTYPFERQRYWIDPPESGIDRLSVPLDDAKRELSDWFYIPSWKRSIPSLNQLQETPLYLLVFLDESDFGIRFVNQLKRSHPVITVQVGSEFARIGEDRYHLNPHQPEGYEALLNDLLVQQKVPTAIVHLWTVTPGESASSGLETMLETIDQTQAQGFYSLLFLTQALGRQNLTDKITDKIHITVVSTQMQSVTGEEKLHPEKATLLGPVKVIAQEYPNIQCRSIDVVFPIPGSWQEEKLIDQLLTEIKGSSIDQIVAYRANHRWVQTFEPVQLNPSLEETSGLREGGVYLITGGLGGIGLVLAEHLAKTAQAKLVLIGRTALPDRHEWSNWLATHDKTDRVSRKLQQLLELEKLGAEVWVISADVANLTQMTEAIAQIKSRFGKIHGVIHAAGLPGDSVIQRKTWEAAEKILAPKLRGTFVLDAIFQNDPLDFLILCSSLASTIGAVGQVDYAAANAFLDAFAHSKNFTGSTLIHCINWDAWKEVGMGVSTPINPRLDHHLKEGLLPSEGIEVFRRILDRKLPQTFVSTRNFLERVKCKASDVATVPDALEQAHLSQQLPALIHSRPELNQTYIAPRNQLEQAIADIWQTALGIQPIGIHDNFFELGGHSLMATQTVTQMSLAVKMNLSLNILFDQPTIANTAGYIEKIRCTAEKLQAPIDKTSVDRAEIEL